MTDSYAFEEASVYRTDGHVHVAFPRARPVLSSAVLNGGAVSADHILNLKVPKRSTTSCRPDVTLEQYAGQHGWQGLCVGMMTAASIDSLRVVSETVDGTEITAIVTAGLSNPRRAGDRADVDTVRGDPGPAGTINIIVLLSAALVQAAMVEAIMIATEAKVAAMQESEVTSPVSGGLATGTGTDSAAVACGAAGSPICYVGKHTPQGETIGRVVKAAVTDSINWDISQ